MTTKEYFKDSELSVDVFEKKYKIENEEYSDSVLRVAKNVAMMEMYDPDVGKLNNNDTYLKSYEYWRDRWHKEILDDIWKPAGSIMSAVGNPIKGISSMNCTTISINGDTLEDIAEARYKLMKFAAYRQGIGVDFTPLRPSGSLVMNSAKVSNGGALNWMEDFNEAAKHIGQSGRIPALLFSIHDTHPDFPEFITLKSDLKKIENANISVQISDAFMKAVENDEDWEMEFRTPHETIKRKEKARDLYNKLLENNLNFSEPGIQFRDTIHKFSNSDYVGWGVVSSNACFTGDMKLLTDSGYKRFDELVNLKKVNIINNNSNVVRGKVWYSGYKDVVKVNYLDKKTKKSFVVTPDQLFMLNSGEKCEAQYLKNKRLMPYIVDYSLINFNNDYIALGFIQGDGQLSRLYNNLHKGVEVNIGKKDYDLLEFFNDEPLFVYANKQYVYSKKYVDLLIELGFDDKILPNKNLPSTYNNWSYIEKASFLRGLFSANGHVIDSDNFRVGLRSTNIELIRNIQRSLLNDFDIDSYITSHDENNVKWENGVYKSKKSYELNIAAYSDIHKFQNKIGFVHQYKNEILVKWLIKKSPVITSVEHIGKEHVYDFSEPISHWGVVNNFIVHNCSEKFLDPSGACNLASFNLEKFPVELEELDKYLAKYMPSIVRFLDNVIDYEEYSGRNPIEEQRKSQRMLRRLGIGFTNLHAWLLKAGADYGGEESLRLVDELMKKFMYYAYKASIELGKEKGSFGAFDRENIEQSPYVKMMMDMGLEFSHMRNVELLSVAPTGSLSTTISKPVFSYGVEPAFGLYYWKRTRISGEYEYYFIVPNIVYEVLKENGVDLKKHGLKSLTVKDTFDGKIGKPIAKLIDKHKKLFNFKPARDIKPEDKVRLMGIIAKYVDSSISTTYILPETATVKDVDDIVMLAWKNKIKSIAIYRDSTRYGIVEFVPFKERVEQLYKQGYTLNEHELSDGDKDMLSFSPFQDKKYVKVVGGDNRQARIIKFKAEGGDKFYVILRNDEKQIFITNYKIENRSNERILSLANKLGALVKEVDEKAYYKQLERAENTLNRFTRMLSVCLKYGLKDKALEILDEYAIVGNLAWYLSKRVFSYNKDEGRVCPQCGKSTLVASEDGCYFCTNCFYSKCE